MSENPGQSEQVRQIGTQLFKVWKAEQDREAKEASRWFKSNIAGWVMAGIAVVAAIAGGSETYGLANDANTRSISNERVIAEMRVENSGRLGSIESKLDILIGERER